MSNVHARTPLDGLLKIVLEQGGDRLWFRTGQEPVASVGERPLRLTVPATSNSMLQVLCGEMATLHAQGAGGDSTFRYELAGAGSFDVVISGSLAEDATGSVRVTRAAAARSAGAPAPTTPPPSDPAPLGLPTNRLPAPGAESALAAIEPALRDRLAQAIAQGASDVHLTEGGIPRCRIHGRLRELGGPLTGLASLLTRDLLQALEAGRAVELALGFEGQARLRIHVYRAEQGLCAAIRILPQAVPKLESLGLAAEVLALTHASQGLVLVVGATGAGKSTTLAALTEHWLQGSDAVCVTLESPIEYHLTPEGGRCLVRQREVGRHVESFATGLRDALREDPDLLLIGEMRDAETTALALTAAETGHLVLSSLHARNAVSAIERIVDLYPANQQRQVRGQLALSLRAVVCQHLLPTLDGSGRAVAAEVMTINVSAAHLIREGKTEQLMGVIQSGKEAGMLPLERDLARLVKQGRVRRSVAREAALAPEFFDQLCPA
jgi:twitching motility protein PilT